MKKPSLGVITMGTLLLVASGCDLFGSDAPLPFAWFQPVTRFAYDYDSATGGPGADRDSAYVIEIVEPEFGGPGMRVRRLTVGSFPEAAYPFLDGITQSSPAPERAEDGIRIGYYASCQTPPFNTSGTSEALWIPADPEVGETYRLYECGGEIDAAHRVVAVDTTITVPAGTFENVFVLQNRTLQKAYWSEPEGLIQIKRFDHESGALIGTFKLSWSRLSSEDR